MRKILLILSLATASHLTHAQGLIAFNNSGSTGGKISINTTPGSAASALTGGVAGTYAYALFYSTTSATVNGLTAPIFPTASTIGTYVTSDSAWKFGSSATSSSTAGGVSGNPAAPVNGTTGGETANFVIVGWSSNIGSVISQLESWLASPTPESSPVYIGESAVVSLTLGNGSGIATPTALSSATIPGFMLGAAPTPEPSSLALAGLGCLLACVARRQKH